MKREAKRGCGAVSLAKESSDGLISSNVGVRNTASVGRKEAGHESTMKILLAEDPAVYRHLISSHLKEWGFDLQVATDGAAAWELLQATDAPRLALLDCVLPKIEGIELCRRIRKAQGQSQICVHTAPYR